MLAENLEKFKDIAAHYTLLSSSGFFYNAFCCHITVRHMPAAQDTCPIRAEPSSNREE
jgi:hypothetical protein